MHAYSVSVSSQLWFSVYLLGSEHIFMSRILHVIDEVMSFKMERYDIRTYYNCFILVLSFCGPHELMQLNLVYIWYYLCPKKNAILDVSFVKLLKVSPNL
jgi:hypothetical protein